MWSCLMRSSCFVHQSTKAGSTEECGQTILTPRRVKQIQQHFPQAGVDSPSILKKAQHPPAGLKSSSPVDSASLSPAKYERLAQVLFRVISSQGLITGLSSAKSHGRPFSAKVPSIPSEVYLWYSQAEFIFGVSPAEFIITILSGIHR